MCRLFSGEMRLNIALTIRNLLLFVLTYDTETTSNSNEITRFGLEWEVDYDSFRLGGNK